MINQKNAHFFLFFFLTLFQSLLSNQEREKINYFHFLLNDQTKIHCLVFDLSHFDLIIEQENEGAVETVENLAKQKKAIAAINGGFFQMKNVKTAVSNGILKIEQKWISYPSHPRGALGFSKNDQKPLIDQLLIDLKEENGVIIIAQHDKKKNDSKNWDGKSNILGGTPLLVWNKKAIRDFSTEKTIKSFLDKKHARTAVGLLPNNLCIFVVVDGTRHFLFSNSGITIPNLALLMERLGCLYALNLDGGGSSILFFEEQIKNTPCGDFIDDKGNHVRKVLNALLVIPK